MLYLPSILCYYSHLKAATRAARALAKKKNLAGRASSANRAWTLLTQFRLFSAAHFLEFPLTPLYLEFIWGQLLCLAIHTEGQHTIFIFLKG